MKRPSSPLRLVKLTVLGAALTVSGYAGTLLPFERQVLHHGFSGGSWSAGLRAAFILTPLLTGLILQAVNLYRLGRGINRLRFTQEELGEARAFVNQRWLTLSHVGLFIAVAVLCVIDLNTKLGAGNVPLLLLLSANSLNYLRSTLRKPVKGGIPIAWSEVSPLHSDRWGQPS